MRIFISMVEAVKEVERDLWEMGHKVHTKTYQDKDIEGKDEYHQKELVGYSFVLAGGSDWRDSFKTLGILEDGACMRYVLAELAARVWEAKNLNPGVAYVQRLKVWEPFIHGDGRFAYTYAERIFDYGPGVNSQEVLLDRYKTDPSSRQLVLPIYSATQDRSYVPRRIPCTMHYQLLHRPPFFYLIHNMRSCDLYTHFAIDLSISWLMAKWYMEKLEIKECQPRVIMQIGSLHAFKKDMTPRGIF